MNAKTKRTIKTGLIYLFLILLGLLMIYPLFWLIGASFKSDAEIFTSLSIIPEEVVTTSYPEGWKGSGQFTFGHFLTNTVMLVVPTVLFTVASGVVVAFGFARFEFPCKRALFLVMLSTLMLPSSVVMIPRYLLYRDLGWLNTYLTFYAPAITSCNAFFIYMLIQFFRGLPLELDEAAYIDGCTSWGVFWRIALPLSKPAMFSAGLFQFIWTWNDFNNALVYITTVRKFPISLALRMSLDNMGRGNWSRIMAMSVVAIMPCVILFFAAQKYFVEGIATTGLKG